MYNIKIENGKKLKCPHCGSIFGIENNKEILYRNITLLHFNSEKQISEIKCKQCKNMIKVSIKDNERSIIN